jgi:hypothetical protein
MFEQLSAGRPESCVSDLRMDAFLAGELDPQERQAVEQHRASCPRCDRRLCEFEREGGAYLASAQAMAMQRALATRSRARTRRPWVLGAGSGLAAAAALGLALLSPMQDRDAAGTRTKGGSRLQFFVEHAGRVRQGKSGEKVRPGDSLRFVYASIRPAYLTIVSFDAAQHASVYLPASHVRPGNNVPLPSSVELDATLGVERIFGLFCERPAAAEEVARALARQEGVLSAPAGCEVDTLQIVKEPRD